ncbi:MAG: hypothetical protein V4612_06620 [Pseudomonadota bacterium]
MTKTSKLLPSQISEEQTKEYLGLFAQVIREIESGEVMSFESRFLDRLLAMEYSNLMSEYNFMLTTYNIVRKDSVLLAKNGLNRHQVEQAIKKISADFLRALDEITKDIHQKCQQKYDESALKIDSVKSEDLVEQNSRYNRLLAILTDQDLAPELVPPEYLLGIDSELQPSNFAEILTLCREADFLNSLFLAVKKKQPHLTFESFSSFYQLLIHNTQRDYLNIITARKLKDLTRVTFLETHIIDIENELVASIPVKDERKPRPKSKRINNVRIPQASSIGICEVMGGVCEKFKINKTSEDFDIFIDQINAENRNIIYIFILAEIMQIPDFDIDAKTMSNDYKMTRPKLKTLIEGLAKKIESSELEEQFRFSLESIFEIALEILETNQLEITQLDILNYYLTADPKQFEKQFLALTIDEEMYDKIISSNLYKRILHHNDYLAINKIIDYLENNPTASLSLEYPEYITLIKHLLVNIERKPYCQVLLVKIKDEFDLRKEPIDTFNGVPQWYQDLIKISDANQLNNADRDSPLNPETLGRTPTKPLGSKIVSTPNINSNQPS